MIRVIAHNIISPLGNSSVENFNAVRNGLSNLRTYEGRYDIPEPFAASLFDETPDFQKLALSSIKETAKTVSFADKRILLVISTVKGDENDADYASKISESLSTTWNADVTSIVVSNACTSGVCAQIVAARVLETTDSFDYAVVCGVEVMSKFIISGFLSLKALSAEPCLPFDIERIGMNPGEAAATMVFERVDEVSSSDWIYNGGTMANDAFHVSSPSPTAIGARRAIEHTLKNIDQERLAFVNAHGTATLYNDEMEAKAIQGCGIDGLPVNSLKGYFGHTMGAAGVLETIISMLALDARVILGSKGYSEQGTSKKLNITSDERQIEKEEQDGFLKLISGFGGSNAAVAYSHHRVDIQWNESLKNISNTASINHAEVPSLKALYKEKGIEYPKFHKMDVLCQLGFLATENLLAQKNDDEECALILFGKSGSIVADNDYRKTIAKDNYFPSPSIFVYTLPNIVCGEIALRHQIHGETLYIQLSEQDREMMQLISDSIMHQSPEKAAVIGWLNADSTECYEATLAFNIQ